MWSKTFVFLFISTFMIANADQHSRRNCPARTHMERGVCPEDLQKGTICIDVCDGHEVTKEDECTKTPECCFVNNTCVSKQNKQLFDEDKNTKEIRFVLKRFSNEYKQKYKSSNDSFVSSRFLQLGGPSASFPSFGTNQCLEFPQTCPPVTNLLQITIPPINIPYCVRVPCSSSDISLDDDMERCLSQPGCYFDRELHNYRRSFGHRVLPTVPVCHLVIRNEVFQKQSRFHMQKLGMRWNPMLTSCLISKYEDEIYSPPRGCDMNDVMEYFGYQSKMAGWNGIGETECSLINGCWKNDGRCVYPMKISQAMIKSGHIDNIENYLPVTEKFGMPKCQKFVSHSPEDFLTSYHTCLASGCSLDASIDSDLYYYNLWNLTQILPKQIQLLALLNIANGELRADNFEEQLKKYEMVSSSNQGISSISSFLADQRGEVNNLFATLSNIKGIRDNFHARVDLDNIASQTHSLFANNPFALRSPFPNELGMMSFGGVSYNIQPADNSNKAIFQSDLDVQCPFRPISLYNYPPLQGSFSGCCERNLCFLPRRNIMEAHSGISNYYSEWGFWSSCSLTCGGGVSTRTRRCVGREDGVCIGIKDESRQCNTRHCPFWASWGPYSVCSKSCESGKTIRSRACIGEGCSGESKQMIDCSTGKCPTYSEWTTWSECSVTCGEGLRRRFKICREGGDYGCPQDRTEMKTQCAAYCGNVLWGDWSVCDYNTCTKTRTARCVYNGGTGFCERFSPQQSQACDKMVCYCKQNPMYFLCNGSLYSG